MDIVYKPFNGKAFNFNKLREEEIFFYLDFNKKDIILQEDIKKFIKMTTLSILKKEKPDQIIQDPNMKNLEDMDPHPIC